MARCDPGQEYAERELRRVQNRLHEIYQQCAEGNYRDTQRFISAHEARVRKYQAQVETGEITQQDYRDWMQGQLFQREQWQQQQDRIAWNLVHADQEAAELIRAHEYGIFCENANYVGYEAENFGRANINFSIYDERAVARLVLDDPDLLPRPTVETGRDYEYYNRKIGNVVAEGILRGQSLEKMMLNLCEATGNAGRSAMTRNARTACHGAQMAGIAEAAKQAKARGRKVKLKWNSRFLPTTREEHAAMDGQTVEPGEPFESELGPIAYPCDPSADPKNVYNCHCYLTRVYEDSAASQNDDGAQNGQRMSYERWKAEKAKAGETAGRQSSAAKDVGEMMERRAKGGAMPRPATAYLPALRPGESYRFIGKDQWEIVRKTPNGLKVMRRGTFK